MSSRHTIAALLFAPLIAGAAMAQDAGSEFNRVSGGQIEVLTKGTRQLSGSLGIGTHGRYEATFGGTLLKDRLWFFGAAQHYEALQFSSQLPEMAMPAATTAFNAKLNAQLGDRHSLAASFGTGRSSMTTMPAMVVEPFPSSILSLHYTGIVSSNMFFTGSIMRRSTQSP
ncbi:MAG TPA: hypothetical protein VMS98_03250 [Thermoanaerobaculia bacterium]|nr:hypothetical protein [Thermoanaerobaculia bacterium]